MREMSISAHSPTMSRSSREYLFSIEVIDIFSTWESPRFSHEHSRLAPYRLSSRRLIISEVGYSFEQPVSKKGKSAFADAVSSTKGSSNSTERRAVLNLVVGM